MEKSKIVNVENNEVKSITEIPQIVITRKEKPNSYEFGKVGNRFKVYFDTPEELKKIMEGLEDWTGEDIKYGRDGV